MLALAPILLSTLAAARPQEPATVVATYQLAGRPATVTRTDLAIELGFHLRRRDRGQQAVEQMVDATLTRRAAERQRLMPSTQEVRAFWQRLQDELRAAGHRPEEFAAVRNSGEAQWLEDLGVQLAQERLVRAELGLGPKESVSGDMMKLWLQEARKRARIVTDPDQLPAGTALRVDDVEIPIIDLGMLLLRTSEDHERDDYVRQVVFLTTVEHLCQEAGIQLTDADLDAAVQRGADEAARDPRHRGITFEQMLKSQGLTIAALRQQRVFRGRALLHKLAQVRFPDAVLAAELTKDRQVVLDLVGPRRRLGIIFVNALEPTNALIRRDFAAATAHLETVRQRLQQDPFEHVARVESEHPQSKAQGGEVGWHRRRSNKLPEALLAAAFAMEPDAVSAPIRGDDGVYLVKVIELEPTPADAVLVARLREFRSQELMQQIVRDAAIQLADAPAAPEAGK
jgi:hypothetical protein